MAVSNRERVDKALELLREGLKPYVEQEFEARMGEKWPERMNLGRSAPLRRDDDQAIAWDTQALLKAMMDNWNDVFRQTLGHTERSYTSELLDVRNAHAHEEKFSSSDTARALDTAMRLLQAVSATEQAEKAEAAHAELMRTIYSERTRQRERRTADLIQGTPQEGLKPWREVIIPHRDVHSGRFQQAQFAADLAQVQRGDAAPEYQDPREFFQRTFLTDGITRLLTRALQRLGGSGGDPVVGLQTNFGGGKTHAMLALFHLFGGEKPGTMVGVEDLMRSAGVNKLPEVRRAVLVGQAMAPGQPDTKPDGTVVRTMWGEMAWQLGGKDGYAMIADSDAVGANPGSNLLGDLFKAFAPCLVLIDEWVAYVRVTYENGGLPAGSFDSNMSFAQSLTEAARATDGTLLVATLPQSDIEQGGEGGREALRRLEHTFGRVEATWRPATAEEGFEIVRRRLFEPITEDEGFVARDQTINAFARMYQNNSAEFPQGVSEGDYKRLMETAYPIHPELFQRLYEVWGSLDRFQRTRGVLRLMAAVIYALWQREDRSLLLLPASVPLDDTAVVAELMNFLDPSWDAIIGADVDGAGSMPLKLDNELPNLGRYSAARRVARALFMATAPTEGDNNAGVDDRSVRLGTAQPGEAPATFGDALRRLSERATYLYVDGNRYWYSRRATISRTAADRAASLNGQDVAAHIVSLLKEQRERGPFAGIHACPDDSADVPDEPTVRLVILPPDRIHAKGSKDSPGQQAAAEFLVRRGSGQRIHRNMLVFLAPDEARYADLDKSVRDWMAWDSILKDQESLNLPVSDIRLAETRRKRAEDAIAGRLKEAWSWLLVPEQEDATAEISWSATRQQGTDALAVRAGRRMEQDGLLLTAMGAANLKQRLDRYLWKETDHLSTAQLWSYFTLYLYLPRLADRDVLRGAIEAGVSQTVCDQLAYAGRYDEEVGRYEGLITTGGGHVVIDELSVVVKPEVALRQVEESVPGPSVDDDDRPPGQPRDDGDDQPDEQGGDGDDPAERLPRRFYGTVSVNPERLGRDAGKVAEEVLQHLSLLPGAKVNVSIEIEAEMPEGADADTQRVVSENALALKFDQHGFEGE
ncbi:MAG: ATP-binding protein [Rhodospirillaceae bacterium]|nr:ATP-binding protein [Rhodospirillaceae bacterium]